MLLVDDYGYDDEMRGMTADTQLGTQVTPEVSWTDFLVSYWLLMGAIIILNLFIGNSYLAHK